MVDKTKILVVDDSAFARSSITKTLAADNTIEVVGQARNGVEAVEMTKSLKPNVVTLDVTMPKMDGIAALEQIMRDCPTPVVMLSALTAEGADVTIKALEIGAVDFFLKPSIVSPAGTGEVSDELVRKIKTAAKVKVVRQLKKAEPVRSPGVKLPAVQKRATRLDKVVVIASSTGGPQALCQVIPAIPGNIPAVIFVVQHMPPGFTKSLANRLNQLSELDIIEAQDGMSVSPGMVLLAPGDYHVTVDQDGKIILNQEPHECGVRPSANVTMESIAKVYGRSCLGVVLTGMGNDGTRGAALIKAFGGKVIAEDESTCSVYGMPASVIEAGLVDQVIPLPKIAPEIIKLSNEKPSKAKSKLSAKG